MRHIAALILAALLVFALVACQSMPAGSAAPGMPGIAIPDASGVSNTPDIGVSLPTQSLRRWDQDGGDIKKQLESKGYTVDLQYANNDVSTQTSQIRELIVRGCKVLVIAAIDGSSLHPVLAEAKAAGVTVVAFERLLMNTPDVNYYVCFDMIGFGALQAEYIVAALGLKDGKGPFNIELFAGSSDDDNATAYYYGGAMPVLKPYIESGRLVVKSGQTDFVKVAIPGWKSENAQKRMDALLTAYYGNARLDAVLSPNDSLAQGIAASLSSKGYGTVGKPYPILTGQDCDINSVKNIIAGKQSMSVFPDQRILVEKVVEMVDAVLQGKEVPVNNTKDYNNGVKVVPSFLCEPVVVTIYNVQVLVDGGYYTEADLRG